MVQGSQSFLVRYPVLVDGKSRLPTTGSPAAAATSDTQQPTIRWLVIGSRSKPRPKLLVRHYSWSVLGVEGRSDDARYLYGLSGGSYISKGGRSASATSTNGVMDSRFLIDLLDQELGLLLLLLYRRPTHSSALRSTHRISMAIMLPSFLCCFRFASTKSYVFYTAWNEYV